ncbi:efflux RND transporter periplasmic adaptor subunit [Aquabacterium sp.]|uniref:efflux RND transporter periplasmic adaptor subunit n=1 Tax=Aquabacterium sp. TaxID=1872578 RepID=UPI002C816635|nr:efflux RND transporter periplasmic adaptor subunit [Aquabacterium sp.]HSW08780.1 efflux RND transporter periplasmic adaptor subunit [Aquabacterium sp.]
MMHSRVRAAVAVLSLVMGLAACGKTGQEGAPGGASAAVKTGASAPAKPLLISPEDLRTVGKSLSGSGPVITGSIQPERRADLRAEVSTVVLQVLKDNGEPVRKGELLVRLDDTAIRDSLTSADESARAASQSFEQAERQFQRMRALQAQGMSSMQAMEDAEMRRNNSQSDLVAARARAASARQQLQRTEVRAPFDGVLADRKVSAGDTAQVGKELVKVIDPASMRFEGLVSADRMQEIKVGQGVGFRVNGLGPTEFSGRVRRIDAMANATTRQVEVLVDFTQAARPKVSGLYAEGRIETGSTEVVVVPEASVQRSGDDAHVWRISERKLQKQAVKLGDRDPRRGVYVLLGGVKEGDQILRNPSTTLVDGQAVEMAAAASKTGG